MRPRTRQVVFFSVLTAIASLTWSQAHSHARLDRLKRVQREAAQIDRSLVLAGTLDPEVTVPIHAANLTLIVPLNSWVEGGQVVGEADVAYDPQEVVQARMRAEEARSASAAAEAEVCQFEEELENAQADASYVKFQWALAEEAERKAEGEFRRSDLLLRQQLVNRFDHDNAVSAREAASVSRAALESRLETASQRISELERGLLEAQIGLNEATERRREAEEAVQRMERGDGRSLIVAPARGLIVAPEAEPGLLGIATDATRLRAYALIRPRDVMSVRVGEPAVITAAGTPAVSFEGQVSEISGVPTGSVWEPDVLMTIAVQNPSGKQLANTPVRIALQKAPQ